MENPRDVNPPPAQTTLCQAGCGFYGSAATDGLCSKCFKESLKRKQDLGRLSPTSGLGQSSSPFHSGPATTSFPISDPIIPKLEREEEEESSNRAREEAAAACTAQASASCSTSADKDLSPSSSSSPIDIVKRAEEETEGGGASAPGTTPSDDVLVGSAGKKKNRCVECNKKVGLTGFNCRCGGLYCGLHRYSDMHKCTFDYKSLGEAEIMKNNPVVAAKKIQKI